MRTTPIASGAEALAAALHSAAASPRATALFCNIDGTLTALRARPSEATVPPATLAVLTELRPYLGLLAFVSGRTLADEQRLVNVAGAAYVGIHGLEIRGADGRVTIEPGAERYVPHVRAVAALATSRFDGDRLGVVVEDKRSVVALHYRLAADRGAARHEILREVVEPARARGLSVITGQGVIEIGPPLAITKGTAIRHLLDGAEYMTALTFGDDLTDVAGFKAVHTWGDHDGRRSACAVAVLGPETPPPVRDEADVQVTGPEAVEDTLRRLLAALGGP